MSSAGLFARCYLERKRYVRERNVTIMVARSIDFEGREYEFEVAGRASDEEWPLGEEVKVSMRRGRR